MRILRSARITLVTVCGLLAVGDASAEEHKATAWDWVTGPSAYDDQAESDWSVDTTLYLWVASLDGDIGLPGLAPSPVSATFRNVSDGIESAFMGFLDARYRRWHLISDNSWVNFQLARRESHDRNPERDAAVDLLAAKVGERARTYA